MKILLTNDDGIHAEGLWALAEEVARVREVVVVAPDREQSAVGTSVTLHHPLRVKKVHSPIPRIETYSVEGTPADSVILALNTLFKDKIDLVISGINEGSNLGNDVLISGTVGAALQGHFYGIPSFAISVGALGDVHYDVAAKVGALVAGVGAEGLLPKEILLNINLPNLPAREIQGIEITRLAGRSYLDNIKRGHDGKREYYWIVRGTPVWDEEEGTDILALRKGRISLTPLQLNLTYPSRLPALEGLCASLLRELQVNTGEL